MVLEWLLKILAVCIGSVIVPPLSITKWTLEAVELTMIKFWIPLHVFL